jgi:hypothetical protein
MIALAVFPALSAHPSRQLLARLLMMLLLVVGAVQSKPTLAAPTMAEVDALAARTAAAEAMLGHARSASASLVQLLVAPDREARVPLYRQIDAANAEADKTLTTLLQPTASSEVGALVAELKVLRGNFDTRYTEAVEEIELNGPQGALTQFWGATRDALEKLENGSARLVAAERARLTEARAALAAAEQDSQMRLLGLAALAVVAVLVLAFVLRRSGKRQPV